MSKSSSRGPAASRGPRLATVDAATVYPLRRSVLRDGRADADATFPEDERPGTLHLAAFDRDGVVVCVATLFPQPTDRRPGARAWRLRGMAVDPSTQGTGVGRALLDDAVRRARESGVEVLWAEGRDSALGFYEQAGWSVEGEGYVTSIGLPHHTVVLDLSQS
jgi:GNAT superfamily N-acetyltransferase